MTEYKGWEIFKRNHPNVWVARQWGVTMNCVYLDYLKEMIDYRIYRKREDRKERQ